MKKYIIIILIIPEIIFSQNFTRQDTLRGSITPERAWWDLTYYHLDISVDPENKFIKGIILSGGPLTITKSNSLNLTENILNLKKPILGICYGHQILAKKFGGKVKISKTREFGFAQIKSDKRCPLTQNFFKNKNNSVWMSHQDIVTKIPSGFKRIASTQNSKFAIISNEKR